MELALPPEWDITFPDDRPLTVDDYLRLPEGPPHFELIDGVIVVNPPPVPMHARITTNLTAQLMPACPPDMEVFGTPLDWVADDHHVLEPDVSVCERDKVGEKRLYFPPVLCVEVLSPSTRTRDLAVKRAVYERGGVAAYWVIDPAGHPPIRRTGRRRGRSHLRGRRPLPCDHRRRRPHPLNETALDREARIAPE